MDFSKEDLLDEAVFVNQILKGLFSYNDLAEMDWLDYCAVIEKAQEIQRNKNNG